MKIIRILNNYFRVKCIFDFKLTKREDARKQCLTHTDCVTHEIRLKYLNNDKNIMRPYEM